MTEITIRKRTRAEPPPPPEDEVDFDPDPEPHTSGQMRWPNGSGVYAAGKAGNPMYERGRTVRNDDGTWHVFVRTGPGEEDYRDKGAAKTHLEAMGKLPELTWFQRTRVAPPKVDAPVRRRVRGPAPDAAQEA